jgi:hypothetical protein
MIDGFEHPQIDGMRQKVRTESYKPSGAFGIAVVPLR